MSNNLVMLKGTLGADPQHGLTKNGKMWANCSLATHKRIKDDEVITFWHKCVSWSKTAELMSQLKKGQYVRFDGELQTRSYNDPEGEKQFITEVVVRDIFIGPKDPGTKSVDHPANSDGESPW